MDVNRPLLYARTIRQLSLAQVVHRARLRGQRAVVRRSGRRTERLLTGRVPAEVGWPEGFTPIDARLTWPPLAEIEGGELTLLGRRHVVGRPWDWHQQDTEQLWRYHLHYWDWAWGLVHADDRLRARDQFRLLLTSWSDQTHLGEGDAWAPYVAALRAWSWCGQYDELVRGTDLEKPMVEMLCLHRGYLATHLELDVGGNHLVKNLKALLGLAVFLSDEPLKERSLRRLEREVARQILSDGGHYERAPAYHCQVLGDLLDLQCLLGDSCPGWLSTAVERMQCWLGLVLLPDGTVPLLNDGYPVSGEELEQLGPGPPAGEGSLLLADSGLAVLRRGDLFVLADVGLPCPAELPAHAHADTLGFLLYAGATRLVGEVGTSTYASGEVRAYERGTAAHSTVQIDGQDSTEVWGAFRAARRARPTVLEVVDEFGASRLSASHDGYARLSGSPGHIRRWTLTASSLRVEDTVTGAGEHDLTVRLHGTPATLVWASSGPFTPRPSEVAAGWERRVESVVLEHEVRVNLPWCFEVELRVKESA